MAGKTFDQCYWFHYDTYEDISLYEVGSFKCPPSYGYGPIIRETYILHYVFSGKGKLCLEGKEYPISSRQIFVIPAGLASYYEADYQNPWNYIWIRFHGSKAKELLEAAGITGSSPVFTSSGSTEEIERCLLDILQHYQKEYTSIGNVYRLFQEILDLSCAKQKEPSARNDGPEYYVQNALNYIKQKYSEPIQIQELAEYCGLNRSYLARIFKQATGRSPQEYLISHRINKAKQLLSQKQLSIQYIAYSVGYNDPFTFSRLFKRETGLSPSAYRKQQTALSK
ncbi:MAG: AraC family transcriptional regulator [Roseburia sp.]|nr:AraC family transcriptional regulator [Roseburia sp.]